MCPRDRSRGPGAWPTSQELIDMTDLTLAVPQTDDEEYIELSAAESIALRGFLAERIAAAANELDTSIVYFGICDGDDRALERTMHETILIAFCQRVLTFNLGFKPALPDELLLDERGMDAVETAAAFAQHRLESYPDADALDLHDWEALVALGDRVVGAIG